MEERNRVVRMETSKGMMTLELYAARAPKTVERFMAAVNAGKYDGLKFHRIIKDFMVQGGDPQGTGMGGGNVKFEGSDVKHVPGVISMAAQQAHVDQSDMQFFIMQIDNTSLDSTFAAFGKVTDGMDVVDKIANVPVGENSSMPGEMSTPLTKITIIRATEVAD